MALVISNSSTLIHLAGIRRLLLLREIYEKVIIPPAVWREVVEQGRGRTGAAEVERAYRIGWIEMRSPTNDPLVEQLKRDLDEGEAEVIALAVERQADLVLLDEADARMMAARNHLQKTGIIGVLIRAKQEGRIASLGEELEALRRQAGFWMTEELYQQALEAVGE